jgi:hypothetical protein
LSVFFFFYILFVFFDKYITVDDCPSLAGDGPFLGEGDRFFSSTPKKLTDIKGPTTHIGGTYWTLIYCSGPAFFRTTKKKIFFLFAQQGKVVRNSARALLLFLNKNIP